MKNNNLSLHLRINRQELKTFVRHYGQGSETAQDTIRGMIVIMNKNAEHVKSRPDMPSPDFIMYAPIVVLILALVGLASFVYMATTYLTF
jgi:hypothetical protein